MCVCVRVCLCVSVCAMCPLGLTHDDLFFRLSSYFKPVKYGREGRRQMRVEREYFRETDTEMTGCLDGTESERHQRREASKVEGSLVVSSKVALVRTNLRLWALAFAA